jgi:autotransporter strand-loop-strand O-heptosyltransferase
MAHPQQQEFCKRISERFPKYFKNKKVLDIGSLDINGNNRFFLTDCNYIGLDVGDGLNVDIVQVAHLYDAPNEQFDLIISTEVFEHDMYYEESVKNIIRMLKPGGAFIFTCASHGRPEHGTRKSDGGEAAPLLTQISEEWSDYYKNLGREEFLNIRGFAEAFPDGIFEYNPNPGDLYFFGVKGGIKNDQQYEEPELESLIIESEYTDDIFVVDTWPNTPEKEADLVECIKRLRQFKGIPILLVSHYPIKPEIQKLVDYYLFDKDNPLLMHEEFQEYGVSSGRWTSLVDYRVDNEMPYHHDYAIWKAMTLAFNFCQMLGKKMIHFMEYDNLLDTFQYRQAFLEKSKYHDAVIYEYHQGSSVDSHLAQYCATFIFSIKTEIAVKMMDQVKSKAEYFMNRPQGWQLERVFLYYLREFTSNIGMTEYIANSHELNTQAVWNRDGIFRDDALFQIYPAADDLGNLYLHIISGFHEQSADRDYLLEVKGMGVALFETLKKDSYLLIDLGKYKKGETVKVNYLGKCVYSLFLQDDFIDFIQMNRLTRPTDSVEPDVSYNFVDGAYVELTSTSGVPYVIKFKDSETGSVDFVTSLKSGHWARSNKSYYKDWKIEVCDKFENQLFDIEYNANGQRVFIVFESSALGDTLAWIPYVDEFRKKHNCEVICSTFWNDLFIDSYPEIKFVSPGSHVTNIYALYRLGYFYNKDGSVNYDRVKTDFKQHPLQHTASEILGLTYQEVKPKIKQQKKTRLKKVGLGIHGTCQAKYWNNPEGWQKVVDWLLSNDYEPVILSKEEDGYMGNSHPIGATQLVSGNIDNVVDALNECSAFIGISSGLTWLSWATDTPTIQISGFTYEFNEPVSGIVKLSAVDGSCSGCANRLKLDQGDWMWCPDQKGTDRQFECSKSITAESVINELKKLLI